MIWDVFLALKFRAKSGYNARLEILGECLIVESIYQFKSLYYKFRTKGQYEAHILTHFLLDVWQMLYIPSKNFYVVKEVSNIFLKDATNIFTSACRIKKVFLLLNLKC